MRSAALVHLRAVRWLALFACAGVLVPGSAHAFSIAVAQPGSQTVVHWFNSTIQYFLNVDGCQTASAKGCATLPPDKTFEQWNAGFQGWMATGCTTLNFQQGYHCNTALKKCQYDKNVSCGVDADCPAAHNLKLVASGYNENGRNELAFVKNQDWTYGDFVLGVTVPVWQSNGAIVESDIAFNGYLQNWTALPNGINQETQHLLSVAIHEEGHFFGVQHVLGNVNQNDPPTMAPYVDPYGKTATLNSDDAKVACFLHPKGGKYTCQTDADCPYVVEHDPNANKEFYNAKLTCVNGGCSFNGGSTTPVGGSTDLGGTCNTDDDCKSGVCQPFGSTAYCSQLCQVSQANCPANFACYPYQNGGGKGACLPGQDKPKPTKNPGDTCTSSAECTTLMCLKNTCRVKCTVKSPVECDAKTEQCSSIPGTSSGACVPIPKPTKKAVGADCQDPSECDSGICLKTELAADVGQCRQKCTGKGTCPDGQACVTQAEGYAACLPGSDKVPAGSACVAPADCDTNLCVKAGTTQFCSKYCFQGDTTSCPCGMSCEQTTKPSVFVCAPGKKLACMGLGAPCADSSECAQGNVCSGGTCLRTCVVGGDNPCAQGEACRRIEAGPAGLCAKVGPGQLSDPCGADDECKTLYCAADPSQGGATSCQTACDPSSDTCGPGRVCKATAGAKVGGCMLVAVPGSPTDDAGSLANDANPGSIQGAITQNPGATSGGCTAGPGRAARGAWWLLMLVPAGLLVRRRGIARS
jgi:hypothetical protein